MSESVETGSTSPNIVAQTRRAAGGGGSVEAAAPGRGWSSWRQTTVPGVWGAFVFACLSFTPSLLPRSGLIQGIVAGVTAAIGYGVGLVLAAGGGGHSPTATPAPPTVDMADHLDRRRAGARPLLRPGASTGSTRSAVSWASPTYNIALVVSLAGGRRSSCSALLVSAEPRPAGRSTGGSRGSSGAGSVRAPRTPWGGSPSPASPTSSSAASCSTGWSNAANEDVRGGGTPRRPRGCSNRRPPCVRAGRARWSTGTPGWQGRTFTGTGPTAADITAGTMHRPAKEPIRAYTGLATARGPRRTGRGSPSTTSSTRAGSNARTCWSSGTTGSGWIKRLLRRHLRVPDRGGDSAIVGMQYSYLPSWMSYLVDQTKAREAGRALFDAVYERWSALPAGGLGPASLSAARAWARSAGESAFSGEADLRNRSVGHGLRRPAQLQHSVPRVPGAPGRRGAWSGCPCTAAAARCASRTTPGRRSRRRASRGTAPACCTSCTPLTRSSGGAPACFLSEPDWTRRTPRQGRAGGRGLAAARDLLAGDGRPDVRRGRPGGARARLQGGSTSTPGTRSCARRTSPPTS